MHDKASRTIRSLLSELHDPFVIFPLQSVACYLSEAVTVSQEDFNMREGPSGVARKYWDVPMELLHEEIGLLIGSAFVLGQATLIQSIAIIGRLHTLSGRNESIPYKKDDILELEAVRDPQTNLSKLVIIDTAANFFKHHHEWQSDWHLHSPKGVQAKTINNALKLGFSEHEITHNMQAALRRLNTNQTSMKDVAWIIQNWRERVALRFSEELGESIDF